MRSTRNVVILGVVGLAVVLTVVVKVVTASPTPGSGVAIEQVPVEASVRVVLVADPREAESSCGCGEIIRMAREAENVDGVAFQEIDPRTGAEQMAEIGVVVAPTVLIWSDGRGEPKRFEGESPEVVEGLRQAIAQLSTPGTPR